MSLKNRLNTELRVLRDRLWDQHFGPRSEPTFENFEILGI